MKISVQIGEVLLKSTLSGGKLWGIRVAWVDDDDEMAQRLAKVMELSSHLESLLGREEVEDLKRSVLSVLETVSPKRMTLREIVDGLGWDYVRYADRVREVLRRLESQGEVRSHQQGMGRPYLWERKGRA